MSRVTTVLLVLLISLVVDRVEAQVTLQQPVLSQFGVSTTVSVPDGGTALLGGVSRSASSRSRYGFWPRVGSSFGRQTSHANVSATVTIHDLHAMDEFLLGLETGIAPRVTPAITARGVLGVDDERFTRRDSRAAASRAITSTTATRSPAPAVTSAERSYALGLRAEREGKSVVARLHFESAARHGSAAARDRLEERVAAE